MMSCPAHFYLQRVGNSDADVRDSKHAPSRPGDCCRNTGVLLGVGASVRRPPHSLDFSYLCSSCGVGGLMIYLDLYFLLVSNSDQISVGCFGIIDIFLHLWRN
jgi:hypothetical protein